MPAHPHRKLESDLAATNADAIATDLAEKLSEAFNNVPDDALHVEEDTLVTTLATGLAQVKESVALSSTEMNKTADTHRNSLYRGTSKVIDLLEESRDQLIQSIKADHAIRSHDRQHKIEVLDEERQKTNAIAESLAAQSGQERAALELDARQTAERIASETEKFDEMISLQRGMLENLR